MVISLSIIGVSLKATLELVIEITLCYTARAEKEKNARKIYKPKVAFYGRKKCLYCPPNLISLVQWPSIHHSKGKHTSVCDACIRKSGNTRGKAHLDTRHMTAKLHKTA